MARRVVQQFSLLLLLTLALYGQTDSITISEVMFNPAGSDSPNEYVEIYNYSSTTSYDLTGFLITDGSNDTDMVINAGDGFVLGPGMFCLIHEGDYAVGSGQYDILGLIPGTAVVVKIDDNVFGSNTGGGFSLTPETITLFNASKSVISQYLYTNDNSEGFPDEKVILYDDNTPANWTNSLLLNGTPGAPPTTDLKALALTFDPPSPLTGATVQLQMQVSNIGVSGVDSFWTVFYEDTNANGLPELSELIDSVLSPDTLLPGEITVVGTESDTLSGGRHRFIALIRPGTIRPFADTITNNNSILDSLQTQPAMDLAMVDVFTEPMTAFTHDSISLGGTVVNVGLTDAATFLVSFYADSNLNGLAETSELIDSILVEDSLKIGDSLVLSTMIHNLTLGVHYYLIRLHPTAISPLPDENPLNDHLIDSLVVTEAINLSLQALTFSRNPKAGQPTTVMTTIRNDGPRSVTSFKLRLYLDLDENALETEGETIDSAQFSGELTHGDSLLLTSSLTFSDSGTFYIMAVLVPESVLPFADEVTEDDLFRDSVVVLLPDSVTITEVMFDPDGTDNPNEFVEIYNYSHTRVSNLQGWKISDSSGTDNLTDAGEGSLLYPGQYAVILEGDYSEAMGLYGGVVPDTARIFKIEGTTIGATDLRNTMSEPVLLITSYGDTLSTYRYSTSGSGQDGYSDEKISPSPDNMPDNWTNSLLLNGTPGAPATTDLKLLSLVSNPVQPSDGQPFTVTATVLNSGIRAVETFLYRLYADTNRNGAVESMELIDSQIVAETTLRMDSAEVVSNINGLPGGSIAIKAVISTPNDTIVGNDSIAANWTVRFSYDVAIYNPRVVHGVPQEERPLTVAVTARNSGTQDISGFRTLFYDDKNMDGFPDPGERIDSVIVSTSLSPSDSTVIQLSTPAPDRGRYSWIILLSSTMPAADQLALNDTARLSFDVSPRRYSIVINEINYQPADTSTEWVEVFNPGPDVLDLQKWKIADGNSDQNGFGTMRTLTTVSHPIAVGEYVVLVKDSTLFSKFYGNESIKRIHVPSFPALNNDGDIVGLLDSAGNVIDSLRYTLAWGGGINRSIERLFPDSSSTSADNWASSASALGGTPGFMNSAVPPLIDVGIQAIEFIPEHPIRGQIFEIKLTVRNLGLATSPTIDLTLKRVVADTLEIGSLTLPPIQPGATTMISFTDSAIAANQNLVVFADVAGDERPLNNVLVKPVVPRTTPATVVINEINYLPADGFSEWVELFNRSVDTVDLQRWRISDEATLSTPRIISNAQVRIPPSSFLVIVRDSSQFFSQFPVPLSIVVMPSLPSLNNSGDQLVIMDSTGSTVDSLFYESSWGGAPNMSLERISPDSLSGLRSNWTTTSNAGGGTPGIVNSGTPLPFDVAVGSTDIRVEPLFPVPGDTVRLYATLRNIGLSPLVAPVILRLYEDLNGNRTGESAELIDSSMVTTMAVGDSSIVMFTYVIPVVLGKFNRTSEVKTLIFQLEYSVDQRPENSTVYVELPVGTRSQTIVINEILFQPDETTTEFIEIYNTSSTPVNLEGFRIADASSSKIITELPSYIPGLSYRVLSADTAFTTRFPGIPDSLLLVVPSMPSLGNSEDAVVIIDDLNHRIDSVYYFASWGGGNGKSLERIDATASSLDPGNWATAVASSKATPGFLNSAPQAQSFDRNQMVINEVMYSPFTGEPEYIELFNPGNTSVNLLNWSIQVGNDKSILITDNRNVDGGDYLVLADQATLPARFPEPSGLLVPEDGLPTLSNDGARIILRDWIGTVIDSVEYNFTWGGGSGISLERRQPHNDANQSASWGSCVFVEGGTPGDINSIYTGDLAKKIKIKTDPNPFFVDEGQETIIQVDLPVLSARLNVKIYDNQGRLINTLLNNSLSGNHREIRWDGRDSAGRLARIGIYVIYVEAIEELGGFRKSAKKAVVLGKRL